MRVFFFFYVNFRTGPINQNFWGYGPGSITWVKSSLGKGTAKVEKQQDNLMLLILPHPELLGVGGMCVAEPDHSLCFGRRFPGMPRLFVQKVEKDLSGLALQVLKERYHVRSVGKEPLVWMGSTHSPIPYQQLAIHPLALLLLQLPCLILPTYLLTQGLPPLGRPLPSDN